MSSKLNSVVVGAAVLCGFVAALYAGTLTPPAGPVQSSMVTLDQLSAQIAKPPRYSVITRHEGDMIASREVLLTGSGVIHAVWQNAGNIFLYDAANVDDTSRPLGNYPQINNNSMYNGGALDIGFTHGIVVYATQPGTGNYFNIVYAKD